MSPYSKTSKVHRQEGGFIPGQERPAKQSSGNDQHSPRALASLLAATGSLSDEGSLSVERAIPELRRGRPVVVQPPRGSGGSALLLAAAETAEPGLLERLLALPGVRLVLPAERLKHMGLSAECAQAVAVAGWSEARVKLAVLATKPGLEEALERGLRAAGPEAEAGLTLLKLARLLPAALAVALPPEELEAGELRLTERPCAFVTLSVADVAGYRDRSAAALTIATRTSVPLSESQDSEFVVFHGGDGERDQLAIVIGEPDTSRPVPVRLHSACLTGDLFGSLKCDCGDQLRLAVQEIAELGGGVILYLDQEGRGIGLRSKIRAYGLQAEQHDTVDANTLLGYAPDERRYAVAARMLALLGLTEVTLLTNNPEKIRALSAAGIAVVSSKRLLGRVNPHNWQYLATKAGRSGHLLDALPLRDGAA